MTGPREEVAPMTYRRVIPRDLFNEVFTEVGELTEEMLALLRGRL